MTGAALTMRPVTNTMTYLFLEILGTAVVRGHILVIGVAIEPLQAIHAMDITLVHTCLVSFSSQKLYYTPFVTPIFTLCVTFIQVM